MNDKNLLSISLYLITILIVLGVLTFQNGVLLFLSLCIGLVFANCVLKLLSLGFELLIFTLKLGFNGLVRIGDSTYAYFLKLKESYK